MYRRLLACNVEHATRHRCSLSSGCLPPHQQRFKGWCRGPETCVKINYPTTLHLRWHKTWGGRLESPSIRLKDLPFSSLFNFPLEAGLCPGLCENLFATNWEKIMSGKAIAFECQVVSTLEKERKAENLFLTFCLSMAIAIVSMLPTGMLCCFSISRFSVSQSDIWKCLQS